MSKKEFNLNHSVFVKLNGDGYKLLAEQHNEYVGRIPKWEMRDASYYESKADEQGYTKFQGWEFMEKFGPVTGLGWAQYYDTAILIDSKNLKEPQP